MKAYFKVVVVINNTMDVKFNLIEGKFTVAEAREVITSLLDFKIQYHNKQSFSSEIRTGVKDELSLTRKETLKATKEQFLKYLENVPNNLTINICSEIQIKK